MRKRTVTMQLVFESEVPARELERKSCVVKFFNAGEQLVAMGHLLQRPVVDVVGTPAPRKPTIRKVRRSRL